MIWVVTLRYDLTDIDLTTLGAWEDALAEIDASTGRIPDIAATLTVYVEAEGAVEAVGVAASIAGPVTRRSPMAVEAVDEQTHLDQADQPNLPRLVSAAEVADQLGISRQRVHQLQSTAGFPEPLYRLRTGPVWDARAIEAFATRWDRRPGRRASDTRDEETPRVSELRISDARSTPSRRFIADATSPSREPDSTGAAARRVRKS